MDNKQGGTDTNVATKKTLEERFEEEFKDLKGGYTYVSFKHFFKSELTSLLRQIEGKKIIDGEDMEIVIFEDIQAIFKEWGIE